MFMVSTRQSLTAALFVATFWTFTCRPRAAPRVSARLAPAETSGAGKSLSYAFINGRWFSGRDFKTRTFYSVAETLQAQRPARVDSTIDLAGGFVVPPFGDAHTHNLNGPSQLRTLPSAYLEEGTFYVQVLTNARSAADAVRGQFNHPCTLDVVYANGGLTSTLSHPFLAYEPFAMGLYKPAEWHTHAGDIRQSRLLENDAYWFIDTQADLDAKWSRILADHPNLIKVFLLDASDSASAPADTGLPQGHGLKPSLVVEVVRRAHAVGRRVAAHIETGQDFALAVDAGVDLVAHLPGYEMPAGANPSRFEVSKQAARLASRRGVFLTPTVSLAVIAEGPDSGATVSARQLLQRRNLQVLLREGVRIVVGSDWYGKTAHGEVETLRALGLWDNLGLLKLWAEATPQAIFPHRRIARLASGYEASFLVLRENPVERPEALSHIALRVKQGCLIDPRLASDSASGRK